MKDYLFYFSGQNRVSTFESFTRIFPLNHIYPNKFKTSLLGWFIILGGSEAVQDWKQSGRKYNQSHWMYHRGCQSVHLTEFLFPRSGPGEWSWQVFGLIFIHSLWRTVAGQGQKEISQQKEQMIWEKYKKHRHRNKVIHYTFDFKCL